MAGETIYDLAGDELVRRVLCRARRVFGVPSVALVRLGSDLVVRSWSVCGDDQVQVAEEPADTWYTLAALIPSGTNAVCLSGAPARQVGDGSTSDAMVAVARHDGRRVGYLVVTDDLGTAGPFDGDALLVAQLMARAAATAACGEEPAALDDLDHLEAELNVSARRDPVTGLPNDIGLIDTLVDELVPPGERRVALSVVRLTPESYPAEPIPDELVRLVARRIASCIRDRDRVTRPLPDDFAIVLEAESGEQAAIAVTRRVLQALDGPLAVDGVHRFLQASAGICLSDGIDDPNVMIDRAINASRSAGASETCRIVVAVA